MLIEFTGIEWHLVGDRDKPVRVYNDYPIYIRAESVNYIREKDGFTLIYFHDDYIRVKETLEDAIRLLSTK